MEDFSIDIERAHELIGVMESVVDHPFFNDSERLELSVVLAHASFEFALSVRLLCARVNYSAPAHVSGRSLKR